MCIYIYVLQSVSQEQRERKVTVDEVPSGIYLYPEEDSAVDNIFTPVSNRSSAALFEEAQKEVLRLMRIEVCCTQWCISVMCNTVVSPLSHVTLFPIYKVKEGNH